MPGASPGAVRRRGGGHVPCPRSGQGARASHLVFLSSPCLAAEGRLARAGGLSSRFLREVSWARLDGFTRSTDARPSAAGLQICPHARCVCAGHAPRVEAGVPARVPAEALARPSLRKPTVDPGRAPPGNTIAKTLAAWSRWDIVTAFGIWNSTRSSKKKKKKYYAYAREQCV